MKTALDVLEAIGRHVRPPRGLAIELAEREGSPNWAAAMARNPSPGMARVFAKQVAELRKSDPVVDWSGITERRGYAGRVARWHSEVEAPGA